MRRARWSGLEGIAGILVRFEETAAGNLGLWPGQANCCGRATRAGALLSMVLSHLRPLALRGSIGAEVTKALLIKALLIETEAAFLCWV